MSYCDRRIHTPLVSQLNVVFTVMLSDWHHASAMHGVSFAYPKLPVGLVAT